jgi:hypothetical protein
MNQNNLASYFQYQTVPALNFLEFVTAEQIGIALRIWYLTSLHNYFEGEV